MQDSERVGRYQLLELFGSGPNGTVSRAKVFGVAGFERQFAVKRFQPELTSTPSAAQSLSAAARSYGGLEHPRIARMSEFGVAQGQTFTAVELVVGLDAGRLVAEAKLGGTGIPPGGALALVSQAARAVGYAHGRGLSHLGLSPTNVIVTADGDVKVTDFGILASTITARPVDTPRLAQRIGYLAPEQLAGEATSAATDVFVLGVIAYELVTGQRAYYADSPQSLAQAILAGPPSEPNLPRPIVRVLSRCLARSQFERFPDARAFADALDAALRVAPVPGTRKDIGAQVKAALDRHAAMNEGQLSGVVAINVSSFRPPEGGPPPAQPAREPHEEVATTNFVRPDVPVGGPAPLVGPTVGAGVNTPIGPTTSAGMGTPNIGGSNIGGSNIGRGPVVPPRAPIASTPRGGNIAPPAQPAPNASATMPDMPKPITTVPGLVVPPPIPVPPGVAGPQPPPIPPPVSTQTMLGVQGPKRGQVPPVPPLIGKKPPALTGPGAPPAGSSPPPALTRGATGGPLVPPGGVSPSGLAGALARAPGAPLSPNAFAPGRGPNDPSTRPGATDPSARPGATDSTARPGATDPNSAVTATGLDLADLEKRAGFDDLHEVHDHDLHDVHDAVTLDGSQGPLDRDTAFEIGAFDPNSATTVEAPLDTRPNLADMRPSEPTVPRMVPAEVHARGGLQPFAGGRSPAVPTDTSPSIEVVADPDSVMQRTTLEKPGRTHPESAPPFGRELPTGQMPPQLVSDLKRLSADADRAEVYDDPLVEMSVEVHGGARLDVPTIAPAPAASAPTSNFGGRSGGSGPVRAADARSGSGPARTTDARSGSGPARAIEDRRERGDSGPQPPVDDSVPLNTQLQLDDQPTTASRAGASSLDPGSAGAFAASSASASVPSTGNRPPVRPSPAREGAPYDRMPSPTPPSLVGGAPNPMSGGQGPGPGPMYGGQGPGPGPMYGGQGPGGQGPGPAAMYGQGSNGQGPGGQGSGGQGPGGPGAYGAGLAGPGEPPISTVPNLSPPPPRQGPSFALPSQRQSATKRWLLIAALLVVVGAGIAVFVWQMKVAGEDTTIASNDGSGKTGSGKSGSNHALTGSGTSGSNTSGSNMSGSGTSGSNMSGSGTSGSNMSGSAMTGSGTTSGSNMSGSGATTGSGTTSGSATTGSGTTSGSNMSGSGAKSGSGEGSGGKTGKETPQPTGSSDALQIASTPAGARVFIDGADQGTTPVKVPGSADRHSMALLLAGHDLYVAEVDGHGSFQIPLKPITPEGGGAAGIKVIKCKKDRYYVFVDGKPTGMLCPTERIDCNVGPHVVEVYDVVTETRRKWDINVTDTRLSYRVRVE